MSEAFVAEIRIFAFNFAPRGWAFCNGQLLPIAQNTALFSLLGTTYGGNGQTNFGLPNLQGMAPMHPGQGPGLTARQLGEQGGSQAVTLLGSQLPAHTHQARANTGTAGQAGPGGNVPASLAGRTPPPLYQSSAPNAAMSAQALTATGGGGPHNNLQPYLVLNFCIAMQGVFPARN
jgi:microcystin-dependent protein